MKSSTKDKVKVLLHEAKGKVKEMAGKSQIIPSWRPKAKPKRLPAKLRKRSARSRSFLEGRKVCRLKK